MTRVPSKPRRRTYRTGENLPPLETSYRPIPLGRDENGEPDGQIRALAVLLRNRADTSVYIREGPEADDSFEIAPGEDYKIWEPNGINRVQLKGESGAETVEVRTLEAHNDFDITDRIEAFARSIAHFVGTATANTTIDGQNVDLSIDDAGGINVVGDVDASGSTVDASGSNVTVDDITAISDSVTIGDITGQTQTLSIDGNVSVDDISAVSDTITIDDVTAASASFDGDITGQNNFDLQVLGRTGERKIRMLSDSNTTGTEKIWTLYDSAPTDGLIEYISFRAFTQNGADVSGAGMSLEMDNGDGNGFRRISPRAARSAWSCIHFSGYENSGVNIASRTGREVIFWYEPTTPISFREGDGLRIRVGDDPMWSVTSGNGYQIDIEVGIREKIRQT